MKNKIKILVTGCAGFIGYNLCKKILKNDKFVVYGIDNLNNYYDIKLKYKRLSLLKDKNFKFFKFDLKDKKKILSNVKSYKYNYIFHLAAQAGVRYSIENPQKYFDSNITGYFNLLEACKIFKPKLIFLGSSSSVYGDQNSFPIKENSNTDKPMSFYAATKKCDEIMSYSYAQIYKLKIVCLRFFTVYGPYGRPDMTPYSFIKNHYKGKSIKVFNRGKHQRDFTYIDDTVNTLYDLLSSYISRKNVILPYETINIARGKPEKLKVYIKEIEKNLQNNLKKIYVERQPGDVEKTYACIKNIKKKINYKPKINVNLGIKYFVDWYKNYHNKK